MTRARRGMNLQLAEVGCTLMENASVPLLLALLLVIGWPDDPQRWNMYAYARNNPLRYVDPDGQDYYEICGNNGKDCGQYTDEQYAKLRKDENFIITNGKIYARNENGTQGDQLGTVVRRETGLDDGGDAVVSGLAARAEA